MWKPLLTGDSSLEEGGPHTAVRTDEQEPSARRSVGKGESVVSALQEWQRGRGQWLDCRRQWTGLRGWEAAPRRGSSMSEGLLVSPGTGHTLTGGQVAGNPGDGDPAPVAPPRAGGPGPRWPRGVPVNSGWPVQRGVAAQRPLPGALPRPRLGGILPERAEFCVVSSTSLQVPGIASRGEGRLEDSSVPVGSRTDERAQRPAAPTSSRPGPWQRPWPPSCRRPRGSAVSWGAQHTGQRDTKSAAWPGTRAWLPCTT